MRLISLILSLICFSFLGEAQNWQMESYGLDEGLPSELVKDIYQSPDGRLWIATDQGLAVYDGHSFQIISDSLSSLLTKKFCPTSNGLLLATDLGVDQLSIRQGKVQANVWIPGQTQASDTSVAYPKTIFQSLDGALWMGEKRYIVKYSQSSGSIKRYFTSSRDISKSFTHSFIFSEDEKLQLWVMSYSGRLLKYDDTNDTFSPVSLNTYIKDVTDWHYMGNQRWIVASYQGLYELQVIGGKGQLKRLLDISWVKRIKFLNPNTLIVGTRDNGVYQVDTDKWTYRAVPSTQNWTVNALWANIQGRNLWVGTDEGVKLLSIPFFNTYFPDGEQPTIHQIIESYSGEAIIATGRKVFSVNTSSTKSWVGKELWNYDGSYAMCIAVSENYLWVGKSSAEVQRIDLATGQKNTYQFGEENSSTSHIEAIWADREGKFVLASKTNSQGFYQLSFTDADEQPKVEAYGANAGVSETVNTIRGWGDKVYIGSSGNDSYLFSFDPISKRLKNLSVDVPGKDSIQQVSVDDIHPSPADSSSLLLATNYGLWQWEEGKEELKPFTFEEDKYTHQELSPITSLASHNGLIWATNASGVVCLTPKNWVLLDKYSGLPSATIKPRNLLLDSKERLWVGTAKGVAWVDLSVDSVTQTTLPPIVRSLSSDGKENMVSSIEHTVLKYDTYISMDVAPLNYPSRSMRYQVRLLPIDSIWSAPQKSTVFNYSDLPAGQYEIQVRAQHVNGFSWSPHSSVLIEVKAPWYNQWWVLLLGLLVMYILLFLGVRWYTYRLRRSKKKLAVTVREHVAESLEQNEKLNEQKEELARQSAYIQEKNEDLQKAQQIIELQNHQLTEANQLLERKVRQRTRELQRTMSELKASNAELDYFIYRSAHDLRGPIARMSGLSQLIAHLSESPEVEDCLKHLDATIKNMESLLDRLLEILKLKSAEPVWNELDLKKILQKQLEPWVANGYLQEGNIQFTSEYWPFVRTDMQLLSRVIDNLIQNAIDFSPKRDNLVIKLYCEERSTRVLLFIEDNGIGISTAAQAKIFDLFYKGNEASKGAGLGLYEAKTLIHKINGEIRLLKSKIGETVFEISLPLG